MTMMMKKDRNDYIYVYIGIGLGWIVHGDGQEIFML
jgi:hypothetical protein